MCPPHPQGEIHARPFENPYADPDNAEKVNRSEKHGKLALKAAHRSAVLLKNDGEFLPLSKKGIKTIAVIGPNAADVHFGGYSWEPREGVSVLDGIREKAADDIEVLYARGCNITKGEALNFQDEVSLADPGEDTVLIKEAVRTAQGADVAILVVGGNAQTCREGFSHEHLGDRHSLDLLGRQEELVTAVAETGTPVVMLLIGGRPLTFNRLIDKVNSIMQLWYLGEKTGTAVADILFGDVNPSGKLPITFPRSVGHIPSYYYHKPSIDIDYLFETREPLYPFGFGLSYTTFEYQNLRVEPTIIGPAGSATVTVEVVNTGRMPGEEIVQLYIRDRVSSVTRPVKELRGFERVSLRKQEKTTVTFTLSPEDLSFTNEYMERVVEPGEFEIMAGPNSEELNKVILTVVER